MSRGAALERRVRRPSPALHGFARSRSMAAGLTNRLDEPAIALKPAGREHERPRQSDWRWARRERTSPAARTSASVRPRGVEADARS